MLYSPINAMCCGQYVFAVDYGATTPVVWPISKVEYPLNRNLRIWSADLEILRGQIFPSSIVDKLIILGYDNARVYIGTPIFEGNIEIPSTRGAEFYLYSLFSRNLPCFNCYDNDKPPSVCQFMDLKCSKYMLYMWGMTESYKLQSLY
jgi:hypothetical protein